MHEIRVSDYSHANVPSCSHYKKQNILSLIAHEIQRGTAVTLPSCPLPKLLGLRQKISENVDTKRIISTNKYMNQIYGIGVMKS